MRQTRRSYCKLCGPAESNGVDGRCNRHGKAIRGVKVPPAPTAPPAEPAPETLAQIAARVREEAGVKDASIDWRCLRQEHRALERVDILAMRGHADALPFDSQKNLHALLDAYEDVLEFDPDTTAGVIDELVDTAAEAKHDLYALRLAVATFLADSRPEFGSSPLDNPKLEELLTTLEKEAAP